MKFFKLLGEENEKQEYAFGLIIGEYPSKEINCPSCKRTWRKDLLLDEQVQLKIALSNRNYPDFLSVIYHYLVSDRVKDILQKENIKGYYLGHDVKIVPKKDIPKQELKELKDAGNKASNIPNKPVNYSRFFADIGANLHINSEVHLAGNCDYCGFRQYVTKGELYIDPFHPQYIDKKTWNGYDVFRTKETSAALFCTEKFISVYEKYKLTGLIFKGVEAI